MQRAYNKKERENAGGYSWHGRSSGASRGGKEKRRWPSQFEIKETDPSGEEMFSLKKRRGTSKEKSE